MKTLATIASLSSKDLRDVTKYLPEQEPPLRGKTIIPVCEPDLSGNEKKYVDEALRSSWISSAGDFVERFEKSFAEKVTKTRFAITVNSGTSALHLALASIGIKHGDEVIVPTFTMVATVNAVIYCGAQPILIDADPVTWNIDVNKIEKKITQKTKAILVVHIYGSPVDMYSVEKLAKKYDLWVVEDAAEAIGAQYKGRSVGSLGDVAAFSLYANKTITTGEGGVVTTNNPDIAKRVKLLHNHAFSSYRHFWHSMVGFGYRMTNLQAAVGEAQVERIDTFISKKRNNAYLYNKNLKGVKGITLPHEVPNTTNAYWMYGILVDREKYGMSKNQLRKILAKRGVETRSFFIPIHFQPIYFNQFKKQRYPEAEKLCRDGLYLPSSTLLTKRNIEYITSTIRVTSRVS